MRIINSIIVIIITIILFSCEIEKKVEDIIVFHYDLSSDTTKITDTIVLNNRIEKINDMTFEFYHFPYQDTLLKFAIGRFKDDNQRIRFGNDTCDLIISKKFVFNGKEIEILKYNLDNLNAADEEAYIFYCDGIGLIAYYYYIWDGMFYLDYENTTGLRQLFISDTGFIGSSNVVKKHQYISLSEMDIYLLNKDKDFNNFRNFHIWQRGARNECFVFDYFFNKEFEKRYLICENDTILYKIIFSENQAEFNRLDLIDDKEYISENLYSEFRDLEIDKLIYDLEDEVFFLTKDGYTLVRSDKSLDSIKRFAGYKAIDENWYYFDNCNYK